ncbi:ROTUNDIFOLIA like 5 [Arabidopsis thaliana]|uniref:Small polypeptide DEVIL 18 n=2 Tax=Arabidopsis thaliana TaxID=3702 RepID=DVL18_ARATH|nr:ROTUNDIFOLIA like 5 [Arabidopsis thaliana]Q8LE84.1 RecName: Full=Small polypeptide DEVIL 18; AltName: Full=Small polypeptide ROTUNDIFOLIA LIKE 5; Short=Small polypeptide ROT-FOUR-LIKE 5 [Arabidopsis thaliana]AAM62790.1 unknown [Arabidopsis thaliana]ABD57503.1 At5g59510 [Arabidopsis thaliana]AED97199.1 ROTUNDIFOLIA like 5 [Arabidopsis thaliana]CAA0410876.1 unnamed protein product [Arabidopsis thaliana]DAA02289.1 TPA_exp: DVL18 [Arabidopsis thaliana]|eukprot:NP_200759.2 ROTUNDIFOLIA like 5 [Arabidopsis thaliana]
MDDENLWKVVKKDSIFETTHFSSKPVFTRSFSTKTSSSSSKPVFTRSFSTKPTSYSSSEPIFRRSFSAKPTSSKSPFLSRSGSTKCPVDTSSTSKCSISRSLSQKGASVTRKCRNMAKEHKSRFYIMKRCVLMLVCWHKHACDS